MRKLGDEYVRSEFRLHKKTTDVNHLNQFYNAWENYLKMLMNRNEPIGRNMEDQQKLKLNEEQKEKLSQLREEVKLSTE